MSLWKRAQRRAGIEARVAADVVAGGRRLPGTKPKDAAPVKYEGRSLWAEIRSAATPSQVHAEILDVVLSALASAGIPVIALTESVTSASLAVFASDSQDVAAVLRGLGSGYYVARPQGRRLLQLTPADELETAKWKNAKLLWVARPVTDAGCRSVIGVSDGVLVGVWTPSGVADEFTAPGPNRWAKTILDDGPWDAQIVVGGVRLPTHPTVALGHMDDVPFPIDAVYTWVDDSDPHWRAKMIEARGVVESGSQRSRDVGDARFRSLDELRFSLRSLEAHAPWIRHVWLVTDGQRPSWLAEANSRLTVVDHREIWLDSGQLPVFNSHAIESRLHHIEGLAEHYVYVNDDVILRRPLAPTAFFSPGGVARFQPSSNVVGVGAATERDAAPARAMKNNGRLLSGAVGAVPSNTLWHVPHAQLRSVQFELEQRFAQEYTRTAGSKFRDVDDISPISLHQWYAYRTGRTVPGTLTYTYVDIVSESGLSKLKSLGRKHDVDVVCVNQSEESSLDFELVARRVEEVLASWFPFASTFERAAD